jgi:hypothetical protein
MADSPDEVSDEETSDALGEVLNMIGGNFKNFPGRERDRRWSSRPPRWSQVPRCMRTLPTKSVAGFTLDFALEGEPLSLTFYYLM